MAETAGEHPIQTFRRRIVEHLPAALYPPELAPVGDRHIPGVAAFPGSHGTFAPCGFDPHALPPFPFGGVMFVGNHLDSEETYLRRVTAATPHGDPCPGAKRMPFWNRLYLLLDKGEIPREHLFATNAHPALLRGESAVGHIPRRYPEWTRRCEELIVEQVRVMQPRVVAALGADATRFLNGLLGRRTAPKAAWETVDLGGATTRYVSLGHPSSYEWQADRYRHYRGISGRAADALLLHDAWLGQVGLSPSDQAE